jgi:CYTH domain-containing protein
MAIEKEQKFRLKYFPKTLVEDFVHIRQAYLLYDDKSELRVRIQSYSDITHSAVITFKSSLPDITSRTEYEYEIPVMDALQLYNSSKLQISKYRYSLEYKGNKVEIDTYQNGLAVVEIEYSGELSPDEIPDFCGEPLDNKEFSNLKLAINNTK